MFGSTTQVKAYPRDAQTDRVQPLQLQGEFHSGDEAGEAEENIVEYDVVGVLVQHDSPLT
ncbi:hypothetical protein ACFWMJ_27220 [Streptomyces hawaiiensis]|uniref:hypothetical protein n=1 Tax=Streptomyces hawaiiensis TaxID=67305 RepID=UPI0036634208